MLSLEVIRRRLVAWRLAVGRESHHLAAEPSLLWPLLHNRLQWEPEAVLGQDLRREGACGLRPGPWLHSRTRPQESEALVLTLAGHTAMVNDGAMSPDGSWIASAGGDGTLRIWDAMRGGETACLVGHGYVAGSRKLGTASLHRQPVNGCAVGPDGTWVVSASDDGTLRIWDVAAATERARLEGHRGTVNRCAVSPDGSWIASAGDDGTVRIWDVAAGVERATLAGHTDVVNDCAIGPDGTWVASVSDDGTLRLWDVAAAVERLTLVEGTRHVRGCAISPDGTWVAASGLSVRYEDGPSPWPCLRIWDAATGTEIAAFRGEAREVYGCAISPDGSLIATAAWADSAELWEVASARRVATARGHTHGVGAVTFGPTALRIVSASADETIKVWDVEALTAGTGAASRNLGDLAACAVAPDGTWVAAVSRSGHAGVWDATSGRETAHLAVDSSYLAFNACAVAPDGSFVVSASSHTGTVLLWDPRTGSVMGHFEGEEWANDCEVAPDGSFVLTASGYFALRIWDPRTGRELRKLEPRWYHAPADTSGLTACAIAPNGSFVAGAGADSPIQLWDPATGKELEQLGSHEDGLTSLAVAPDGSYLVSAGWDRSLRLWDRATGAERARLVGHTEVVTDCAISPDGAFVASVSRDRTIRLWDPVTGVELCRLPTSAELASVAIGPGGSPIACTGAGGFLALFDVVDLGR